MFVSALFPISLHVVGGVGGVNNRLRRSQLLLRILGQDAELIPTLFKLYNSISKTGWAFDSGLRGQVLVFTSHVRILWGHGGVCGKLLEKLSARHCARSSDATPAKRMCCSHCFVCLIEAIGR